MFSAKVVIFLAAVAVCYGAPSTKSSHKGLKIDGGTLAKIEDYPFTVSVHFCANDFCDHICGGVIVNENWVLTSSNCIGDHKKIIVFGTSTVDVLDPLEELDTVDVEAAYRHPFYPRNGLGPNDIALLKLAKPLTFNDKVQPAKLPTQGQEFNGTAVATGYGLGFELIAATDLSLVSFDECNKAVEQLITDGNNPLDKDSNLCTLNEVSNNCGGDIGGPLSQDGTVIGLITWFFDEPCSTKGAPNVFTKLSNYADWINKTITELN